MAVPMDPLVIPTYLRVPKGIPVWEQDPNRQLAGSSCSFSFVLMLRRFEVWCPGEGMMTKTYCACVFEASRVPSDGIRVRGPDEVQSNSLATPTRPILL